MSFKSTSVEGLLLSLGTALFPVYVFGSGGVQPSHAVLALFFTLTFLGNGIPVRSWGIFLGAISCLSFFVESFYIAVDSSSSALISSTYFFYNFFLAVAVYSYCSRRGLSVLAPGVVIASVIVFGVVFLNGFSLWGVGQGRPVGTFNNPNQLGYFSVCVLSFSYLLSRHRNVNYLVAVSLYFLAIILAIASLSKAAMISNFFVVFLILFFSKGEEEDAIKEKLSVGVLFFFLVFFVFVASTYVFFDISGELERLRFVARLQGMLEENDSSLEARGYLAFLEANAFQLFLGLGKEGAMDVVGNEVHSTFGSVFNVYGLVGLVMFSGALGIWALRLWDAYGFIGMVCLTGPAMLYGLTHNGTRFSIFWILLGASMAMADGNIATTKNGGSVHRMG